MKIVKSVTSSSSIYAAESAEDSRVDDMISELKDDFDFIISAMERLSRQGANGINDALVVGENVSKSFQSHIESLANNISNS